MGNVTDRLWPTAASSMAPRVDHLFVFLLAVTAFFVLLIALVIVYFVVRYRRRPGVTREVPNISKSLSIAMESGWTIVPLGICMVMFFWAASLYVEGATFPSDADEVLVVGKQWMWKIQHAGGQREINELHVPVGHDVKLVMTSEDVIHSFYVPAFRLKMDVLPERYTFLWFKPTKAGIYHLFCAEYCGTQHARMGGRIVAMEAGDYAEWLATRSQGKSPRDAGAELFARSGCPACHQGKDAHRAPPLEGVYGSTVLFVDGSTATADENYLRESVVNPAAKVAAGYTPVMPSYQGSFTEDELLSLVTYLKSLGGTNDER